MTRSAISFSLLLLATAMVVLACGSDTKDGGDADSGPATSVDAAPEMVDAAGAVCATSPCDLYEQCGCDDGFACDLDPAAIETAGTLCRDVLAPGAELVACTESTECGPGYGCLGQPGQCRRYCRDARDCGGSGECVLDVESTDGVPAPGVLSCSKSCDPTAEADGGCPDAFGCHLYFIAATSPADGDGRYVTDCEVEPESGGAIGDTCTDNGDCQAGADCLTVDGATQCRATCECPGGVCANGECPSGRCTAFNQPLMVDGITYGVCI